VGSNRLTLFLFAVVEVDLDISVQQITAAKSQSENTSSVFAVGSSSLLLRNREREQPPPLPTTQPPPLDDYDYEEIDYTGGSARRAILSIKFGTAHAHLSFRTLSYLSRLNRRRQGGQDGNQTRRRPPLRPVRIFQSPGAM